MSHRERLAWQEVARLVTSVWLSPHGLGWRYARTSGGPGRLGNAQADLRVMAPRCFYHRRLGIALIVVTDLSESQNLKRAFALAPIRAQAQLGPKLQH